MSKGEQRRTGEMPAQKCARLVAALEDLAGQETACVRANDFETYAEIQGRAASLVAYLANHSAHVTDAGVRRRLAAVLKQREAVEAAVTSEVDRIREQLVEVQAKQRRAAQVAPAYGGAGHLTRRRLDLVG